jgi:hypothetical protein
LRNADFEKTEKLARLRRKNYFFGLRKMAENLWKMSGKSGTTETPKLGARTQ